LETEIKKLLGDGDSDLKKVQSVLVEERNQGLEKIPYYWGDNVFSPFSSNSLHTRLFVPERSILMIAVTALSLSYVFQHSSTQSKAGTSAKHTGLILTT